MDILHGGSWLPRLRRYVTESSMTEEFESMDEQYEQLRLASLPPALQRLAALQRWNALQEVPSYCERYRVDQGHR